MVGASECMTAEQLLTYSAPDKRVELVRGHLAVREPLGWYHGEVTAQLCAVLHAHLASEQAQHAWPTPRGRLAAGDPGFILARGPDPVRAPDVAYVSHERHPGRMPAGYPELAPDLAIEVRSPTDRPGEVLAKVGDWLEAGARLVWVIDPQHASATVYRADGTQAVLTVEDALNGEDVLPGFTLGLHALFDRS
jgi:Uma2 family endonuclease